ncbi:tyrosine-type recombinase/integrase [Mycolicibacterium sp. XJ879]
MAEKKQRRGWGKVRKLPSGRYQASYAGPDHARHVGPITYGAKAAADAWLASERRLIELDAWTPPAQRAAAKQAQAVTVEQYARQWVAQRPVKPRTKLGYERLVERTLSDTPLGELTLREVTPEAVRAWYAALGSSTPTRNSHAYAMLHAIFATAADDDLVPFNPCKIKGAMSAPTKRQPADLTPAQVAAVAAAMPDQYRCAVLVAAWLGLRWGELSELRRADVSPDRSMVTVARAVTHRSGQCFVASPKSGHGRKVVVPPHIRDDLADHLARHVASGPDALLFAPVRDGCHLNDRVFRDHFVAAQQSVGLDGIRTHDLRHFAGRTIALVGGSAGESMQRLGHRTYKAAVIYQSAASDSDQRIAAALSKLATE